MIRLISLAGTMACSGLLVAQDAQPAVEPKKADAPQKDVTAQIKELMADRRNPKALSNAFALAKENLKLEVSWQVLVNAATRSRDAKIRKDAKELLMKDFMHHDAMSLYCRALARSYDGRALGELRMIMLRSNMGKVRRSAAFSLAGQLARQCDMRRDFSAEKKKMMTEEALGLYKALKTDPALLNNPEAKRFLATIDGRIFTLEKLSIGCVAPEIEGKDQDGKVFKLSDYRGKVTLVDFWGIW